MLVDSLMYKFIFPVGSELEIYSEKDKKWKLCKVVQVDEEWQSINLEVQNTETTTIMTTWINDKSKYLRKTLLKRLKKNKTVLVHSIANDWFFYGKVSKVKPLFIQRDCDGTEYPVTVEEITEIPKQYYPILTKKKIPKNNNFFYCCKKQNNEKLLNDEIELYQRICQKINNDSEFDVVKTHSLFWVFFFCLVNQYKTK